MPNEDGTFFENANYFHISKALLDTCTSVYSSSCSAVGMRSEHSTAYNQVVGIVIINQACISLHTGLFIRSKASGVKFLPYISHAQLFVSPRQ